jgi:next-to-BRCA1 protein 1
VRSKHSAGHKFFCISLPSDPIHKNVVCDACDLTIAGVRHKCLDCADYDLCTSCIREGALEKHSPFHEFYDIKEPGKVVVHTVYNSEQRSSTRPQPQQGASEANTAPTSVPAPASTSTPQQDVAVYHSAVCNLCDNQIVGARYKCLACPDFDTCTSCFSITPTQHPIHGFVKVKAKEDINVNLSVQPQERHAAWCDSCKKVNHPLNSVDPILIRPRSLLEPGSSACIRRARTLTFAWIARLTRFRFTLLLTRCSR